MRLIACTGSQAVDGLEASTTTFCARRPRRWSPARRGGSSRIIVSEMMAVDDALKDDPAIAPRTAGRSRTRLLPPSTSSEKTPRPAGESRMSPTRARSNGAPTGQARMAGAGARERGKESDTYSAPQWRRGEGAGSGDALNFPASSPQKRLTLAMACHARATASRFRI